MTAIIQLALTLLTQIAPQLGGANATLIAQIVNGLIALVPLLIKEYQDAVPFVQNIITLIRGNGNVTPEQLAQLDILETQIDAAFEVAAAKALADDAAAD
jgi:hypothetical protein